MLNLHLDPNPPPQAVVAVDFGREDTAGQTHSRILSSYFSLQPQEQRVCSQEIQAEIG